MLKNRLRNIILESVRETLNEISPEMKARAMVKANHDLQRLNLSDKDVETNLNGEPVHKDTQKRRRDRQLMAFKNGLEKNLTKKYGREVKFGIDSSKCDERNTKWNDDDDTYYDNLFSVDYDDDKFRHFARTDSTDSGTRFSPKDNINVDRRDIRASDYLTKMVDGMAGYDSPKYNNYESTHEENTVSEDSSYSSSSDDGKYLSSDDYYISDDGFIISTDPQYNHW